MILQITFSPTGGTKRVGQQLCQNLGTDVHAIELCVPEKEAAIIEALKHFQMIS